MLGTDSLGSQERRAAQEGRKEGTMMLEAIVRPTWDLDLASVGLVETLARTICRVMRTKARTDRVQERMKGIVRDRMRISTWRPVWEEEAEEMQRRRVVCEKCKTVMRSHRRGRVGFLAGFVKLNQTVSWCEMTVQSRRPCRSMQRSTRQNQMDGQISTVTIIHTVKQRLQRKAGAISCLKSSGDG